MAPATLTNEALIVVEKLRAKYPEVPARVVISGEPSWPNAKVFSLAKMIASSENSFFVISDSDVLVGPDFLRSVVPPLLDQNVGLVTCLYEGIPTPDFWSQLEALGMSVEMPAGVMVAEHGGRRHEICARRGHGRAPRCDCSHRRHSRDSRRSIPTISCSAAASPKLATA